MRTMTLLLLALIAGCAPQAQQRATPTPAVRSPTPLAEPKHESIENQLLAATMLKFFSDGREPWQTITLKVVPVDGHANRYVAMVDFEAHWWGTWCTFGTHDGVIVDLLWDEQEIQGEQCMHQIRGFSHPMWEGMIVEAYGMTHMGNGNYYLIHVHDGRMETLITTRAVDAHVGGDGAVLQESDDYVMPASYYDFDKDGFTDVVLQGRVVTVESPDWCCWNMGWDGLERPVRKVFLWSPERAAFERAPWLDIGSFD